MTHVFSSFSLPALIKPKVSFHVLNTIFALSVATYAVTVSPYAKWLCLPISLKNESVEDIARLRNLCAEAFNAIYVQALTSSSTESQGGYTTTSLPLTSHLHPIHLRFQKNPSSITVPDKDILTSPHVQNSGPMKTFNSFQSDSKPDFPSPESSPPNSCLSSKESLSRSSSEETLTSSYSDLSSALSYKSSLSSASHSDVPSQLLSGSPEYAASSLSLKEALSADTVYGLMPLQKALTAPSFVTIDLIDIPHPSTSTDSTITTSLDDVSATSAKPWLSLPLGQEEKELQQESTPVLLTQAPSQISFVQSSQTQTAISEEVKPSFSPSSSPAEPKVHTSEEGLLRWEQYMSRVKNHNNRVIRDWLMKAAFHSKIKPEEIPFRIALIETILKFQDYINADWEDPEASKGIVKLHEKFPTNHAWKDPNDPKMLITIGEMRREFHYEYLKTVNWSKTSHGKLFLTPELEFENNFHGVVVNAYDDGYDFPKNLGINAYYNEDIHD